MFSGAFLIENIDNTNKPSFLDQRVILQAEPCIGTNAGTDETRGHVLDTTTEREGARQRGRDQYEDVILKGNVFFVE